MFGVRSPAEEEKDKDGAGFVFVFMVVLMEAVVVVMFVPFIVVAMAGFEEICDFGVKERKG